MGQFARAGYPSYTEEDEELVRLAKAGHAEATRRLLIKYHRFVRVKANSYFLAGGDMEDLVQEGYIGLYKAIRDFEPGRSTSFRSFAELCVTRQLITAIKTATRQKHTPLNTYISLHRPAASEDEGDRVLSDILAAREVCDPAEVVIAAWETASIKEGFTGALSGFETDVLRLYVAGSSYCEIADELGRHSKAVDNALQRVKRKVEIQIQRCRAC